MPVPVAARSKTLVCARSRAEIVGSNPAGGMDVVCCECCVLSGRGLCDGWSLVQSSPTDCGASLCVWSRNLIMNEEATARFGMQRHEQKMVTIDSFATASQVWEFFMSLLTVLN
jgi:hypothetical protein